MATAVGLSTRGPLGAPMATAAFRAALAMDVKNSQGATQLLSEVSQHLERITVAVLGQEILTKSALEMALLPILLGTWEEERAKRFCTVCWDAAFKAAQKTRPSAGTTPSGTTSSGTPSPAVAKAMEVMAEHHATELLQEEQRSEKRKTLRSKAKPPPSAPSVVVHNDATAAVEDGDEASESSGDLKVRDQSNPFSILASDVKDDSSATGSGSRKAPGRDRCKWTVKSYKNGQETTWDVLETDGHLNNMRIVGKESVSDATGPRCDAHRGPLMLAPKGGDSEKEGRAKSAHSTLSYSETAEEEHSISMMRTVSSGTGQRLLEELEEDRRWEMNLEGLEEGLRDEVSIGEPDVEDEAPPDPSGTWQANTVVPSEMGAWQEQSSAFYSNLPPSPPVAASLPPPWPLPPAAVTRRPAGSAAGMRVGRTPSAPSRLEQSCPPSPLFLGPRDMPPGCPGYVRPRRRVASYDYNFTLARQLSLDSSLPSERSLTQTPPGLFPSTPECDPSPSTGFMLPPLHNLPTGIAENSGGPLMGPQVVYVPVLMPHRCSHCGHECVGGGPPTVSPPNPT